MLHVQLSAEQKKKLRKLAEARGTDMTDVIEDMIDSARMPRGQGVSRGETRGSTSRTSRRA